MLPGLDLYYTDRAQPLATAGEELLYNNSFHDFSIQSVRGVLALLKKAV